MKQQFINKALVLGVVTKKALVAYMDEVKYILFENNKKPLNQIDTLPTEKVFSYQENFELKPQEAKLQKEVQKDNVVDFPKAVTPTTIIDTNTMIDDKLLKEQIFNLQKASNITGDYILEFHEDSHSICGITVPMDFYRLMVIETENGKTVNGRYSKMFRSLVRNPSYTAVKAIIMMIIDHADKLELSYNGNIVCKQYHGRLKLFNDKGKNVQVAPKHISYIHGDIVTTYTNGRVQPITGYKTTVKKKGEKQKGIKLSGDFQLVFDDKSKEVSGIKLPSNYYKLLAEKTNKGKIKFGGYTRSFRRIAKNPSPHAQGVFFYLLDKNENVEFNRNGDMVVYEKDGVLSVTKADDRNRIIINPRLIRDIKDDIVIV